MDQRCVKVPYILCKENGKWSTRDKPILCYCYCARSRFFKGGGGHLERLTSHSPHLVSSSATFVNQRVGICIIPSVQIKFFRNCYRFWHRQLISALPYTFKFACIVASRLVLLLSSYLYNGLDI